MELCKAADLLKSLTISELAAWGGTCRAKNALAVPVLTVVKRLVHRDWGDTCQLCKSTDLVSDVCWGCNHAGLCKSCHFVVRGPVPLPHGVTCPRPGATPTSWAPLGCTLCLMCGVGRGATTWQFAMNRVSVIADEVIANTDFLRTDPRSMERSIVISV